MLHLAFMDQPLDCSGDIFDRHLRVNAVLVEEVDHIRLEPLERGLGDALDLLGPAIQFREIHDFRRGGA